jgi:hypothetical protein
MLVSIFPTNKGAENTGEHPLELVTEDTVDDEVDGTVEGNEEIVSLCESVENLAKVLKILISAVISFAPITSYCFDWSDQDSKKVEIYFHFKLFFPPNVEFEGFQPKFTSTKFGPVKGPVKLRHFKKVW